MKLDDTKWINDCWGIWKRRLGGSGKVAYFLVYDKEMQATMGWFPSKRQLLVSLKRTYIRSDLKFP